jgi:hypothetical protein
LGSRSQRTWNQPEQSAQIVEAVGHQGFPVV